MHTRDSDVAPTVIRPADRAAAAACPEAEPAATTAVPAGPTGADGMTRLRPEEPSGRTRSGHRPTIDGYELLGEIARGGMGVVYAARDVILDREVAVKVMLPGMDAAEFVRESRVTARLPHPGIPPVYALGTLPEPDGRPFLAMKLIRGDTLDELLRARTDPSADRGRFVSAFKQICQAVGYAHARGIVHRDLKPSNVMVGSFGEVQVMDWGLAKEMCPAPACGATPGANAGGRPARACAPPADLPPPRFEQTVAGQVKGTPAYMAPEQARGEHVDARTDVFALGGILAVKLTGRPPFVGACVRDTVVRAAGAELGDVLARLDGCGADRELVALAKRCLAARPDDRPANGQEVAEAVTAYRAGVECRLQQAERDRAVSAAEVREQHKRRRVQLLLAGVVVVAAVAGAVAANRAQEQRADDRIAAEEVALRKQRQTRADVLVDALATADTVGVSRLIDDLKEVGDLTGTKLRALAEQPVGTRPGLHGRLALVAEGEPAERAARAAEVAAYLPVCRPDQLLAIRELLKPHAAAVAPGLWGVLGDANAGPGPRVRAACALAGLAPDDARWAAAAPAVAETVVRANPVEYVAWAAALEPVCGRLLPALMARYPASRRRVEAGKLSVSDLAAEVAGFDRTADLLARAAADRVADLAELAITADPRHYQAFAAALAANRAAVVPLLKAELARTPSGGPDPAREEQGKRRGYAAAALVALGEAEAAWPLFAFPPDGDPTARSYLLERLAPVGADPVGLVRRFGTESDVSARRALVIALGEFPPEAVPAGERTPFVARLSALYRDDPDPGLHSAVDWLLRQKWGDAKELTAIDAELAARAAAGRAPVAAGAGWFVNGQGQTFAVVRGPVEFVPGSPETEPGRVEGADPPRRTRIGRTFAIATKEVTAAEFRRFRPSYRPTGRSGAGPDTPAVGLTWYDAAEYCNWLSAEDGIPAEQWSYAPNRAGRYADGMAMTAGRYARTGYRLPTDEEWECACRAGAATARHFGCGDGLLPRYGWFAKTSDDRTWPVGRLRPNDRGLFDALGNAMEWVEDVAVGALPAADGGDPASIDDRVSRLLRGGSFLNLPVYLRSADGDLRPGNDNCTNGFRPVRTIVR